MQPASQCCAGVPRLNFASVLAIRRPVVDAHLPVEAPPTLHSATPHHRKLAPIEFTLLAFLLRRSM